jgi:hypothetical protein
VSHPQAREKSARDIHIVTDRDRRDASVGSTMLGIRLE